MIKLDHELREKLRGPLAVWAALLGLVSVVSAVGVLRPRPHWWIIEAACLVTEIALVLVVSMEMFRHKPIVRLVSVLGFFWVGILFGMPMLDYLTR